MKIKDFRIYELLCNVWDNEVPQTILPAMQLTIQQAIHLGKEELWDTRWAIARLLSIM